MADVFERIAAARKACSEALDTVGQRMALGDAGQGAVWDASAALGGLEGVERAFADLGAPERLRDEVPIGRHAELRDALTELARVHIVLTMTAAREKDALRDRLTLTARASRDLAWHAGEGAGVRCDLDA